MKTKLITLVLTLALCGIAAANSQQDNSPNNGVNNSSYDKGKGNHGVNNGQHNNSGGQGGNGGQGGQGGSVGSVSSSSSSTSIATAAQTQGQTQSSSASNGDQANAQSTTFNQNQVRQAPTVIAPDAFPSAPCRVAGSVGASAPVGGLSLGGSKLDTDCDKRETARSFLNLGQREAACKILLSTKAAKAAGLTSADCVLPMPVQNTVITLPPVTVNIEPSEKEPLVSINGPLTNEGKAALDDAVQYLKQQSGGYVLVQSDAKEQSIAKDVQQYLVNNGITVQLEITQESKGDVEVYYVN